MTRERNYGMVELRTETKKRKKNEENATKTNGFWEEIESYNL
jgi:hypothetical protein